MRSQSSCRRFYLFAYNTAQWLLWALLLASLMKNAFVQRSDMFLPESIQKFWLSNSSLLQVAQSAAIIELINAFCGLVRTDMSTATIQVVSRLHIVWGIFRWSSAAQQSVGLYGCILAWSLAELVRYAYYATQSIHWRLPWLTKLRYSVFMVLYPAGITSEVVCIFVSFPVMYESYELRHWPYPMPNVLNFEINLFVTYLVVLMLYIPGSIHMYNHMLHQRRKVADREKAAEEKKTL
eukprot:GHVH01003682.1.p1 GENE.GHVH01003682.1~~GHVH01003682.1.p1  ORF type:complete len:237 (+),score=7.86 GHVH01003682.1:122-832(+)